MVVWPLEWSNFCVYGGVEMTEAHNHRALSPTCQHHRFHADDMDNEDGTQQDRPIRFFFSGFIPYSTKWNPRERPHAIPDPGSNATAHHYHRLALVRKLVYEVAQTVPAEDRWVITRGNHANYTASLASSVFCLVPGGIGPGWYVSASTP